MSQETLLCDVAVIGAGPGGYAAAFLAADHGKKVALIDQDASLGGVCLNRGCIPSKALLHFAKLIDEAQDAAEHGVVFGEPKIDLDKVRAFKNKVVGNLSGGIAQLAKARKVEVLQARASFASSTELKLDGHPRYGSVQFQHAILATGSRPAVPGPFNLGDPRIMDSTGALALEEVPKRLLVIGGGYIGLEMGTAYRALGCKVTVVELLDGLLMGADRDLVKPLQQRLEKQFEAIYLRTKVAGLKALPEGIEVTFDGEVAEKVQLFDRVLISTGRRPNHENLGLETTKVFVTPKGFVEANKQQRTADPHIMAIGDIAGEPMLAHKAAREARVAVEVLLGQPSEFDNAAIPAVVFTDPEIAWAGVTEMQAAAEKREVLVMKFPWAASGRAQSLGRTEGLTKLICEPRTERVIGAGIVGPGAGEMIAEAVLAIEMAAVARDVADTIHAHPTLSETVMESAEMLHGNATHFMKRK